MYFKNSSDLDSKKSNREINAHAKGKHQNYTNK